MSYTKHINKHNLWLKYCSNNTDLIKSLNLSNWIFEKEGNFRQFATCGKTGGSDVDRYDFNKISDSLFWELFLFSTNFFEMDSVLFNDFEKVRIGKSKDYTS